MFLAFVSASSAVVTACRSPTGVLARDESAIGITEFMRLSQILTGVPDLDDEESGLLYLSALNASPEQSVRLAELWERAQLLNENDPAPLYEKPDLAKLADAILANWYSGLYTDGEGRQRVATYVGALGWQALGYRPLGPTTCGGAFGHWSAAPTV